MLKPELTICLKVAYLVQHPFNKVRHKTKTYHCRVRREAVCSSTAQLKKMSPCVSRKSDLICSEEYCLSSVFDCKTMVTLPRMRKMIAGRSYFHIHVSLRKHMAKIAATIIAVAELAVSIVISAKGRTP